MSHEVELKFRIPAARLAAVRRAVATASARPLALAARYMETADGDLARARVALRLRQEGDSWVQTLKAEGRVALQRLEHNVVLAAAGPQAAHTPPGLDIARHDGSPAGARLREVLAGARNATLREHYATQVQRTWRHVRHQGAVIELALDEGEIRAGGLVLPVCEIEFELIQGDTPALLDLAARWSARFGLWLDVRSKSERGHALAHQARQAEALAAPPGAGLAVSPPTKARRLTLESGCSARAAVAAMLGEGLQQSLANASQIADGQWQPEHLHQLRVGLRRLRTVLRLYRTLLPGLDAPLAAAVAQLFTRLSQARDRDVRAGWLWPALQAAGAPALAQPEPAAGSADLPALLCAADTQALWLRLLALSLPASAALGTDATTDATTQPLRDTLARALRHLLRQVRRDAQAFATLDDAARHRLRRRIKRLRYATELSVSLWPARPLARFVDALQAAQGPLGELNDAVVAAAHCRALAAQQPEAWFAVGWLAARHDAAVAACTEPMAALAELRGPWAR
ncbi:CYTH and CHAD domain-containing protein [Aquabacterium sp. OR-4]|uniref:CYTH and CHAD domain-containing protein n=1 Tax=Aquabacterium sp. OR-4 TaxID=2978127 RepID=UPI0021B3373A|nr:CYTH and CHAD domain-containing protein [Aquabacterium sp. OR-4]MDT7834595.1 CHAD domain-containing protein [Aquabacterium sp. OR-4]